MTSTFYSCFTPESARVSPTEAVVGAEAVDADEVVCPGEAEGVPDRGDVTELLCGEVTTDCPLEHPAASTTSGKPASATVRRIRSSSLGKPLH
ncbi:hypothetical protein OG535_39895 [Kitasatospora sp. NBC_00085]|uniref:hypothetical protein n=1 Tax=unclassified Kitasatospora TaxID=2633591 RepID=UPI0032569A93